AVLGEIKRDQRNVLAQGVTPDVLFRPMQQRMDADMGAGRKIRLVLVPEFGRLVAEIPLTGRAAWAEDPLLGAGSFLITADGREDAGEVMLVQDLLQSRGLARRRAGGGRQTGIDLLQRRAG